MNKEGQFRQLLNDYQEQSQRNRYLRNKSQAIVDEVNQLDADYPPSAGRRRHKIDLINQLKQINGYLRQGGKLDNLDDDLVDETKEAKAQAAQARYQAQQRQLHESRKALALAAGLSTRYCDSYWVDIEIRVTHFYFGGTNGSSGDDGHGHYTIENINGLASYRRSPFSRHGGHNVVRWLPPAYSPFL